MSQSYVVYVVATIFGISILLFSLRRRRVSRRTPVVDGYWNQVLFFPDCSASGENYRTLSEAVNSSRRCVDVCVYCLSNRKLVDILIGIHRRGSAVRVITDREQETVNGGQAMRLRQSGIQVRTNSSPYFMHHKFCVIDNSRLVNGSLNWTAQGVECNEENIIITDNLTLVRPFLEHFDKLWTKYDPLTKVQQTDPNI